MREFLENAETERASNSPDKVRAGAKPVLPKRFYTTVSLESDNGSITILLDGKPVKTPGKNALELPTVEAAKLVAKEWEQQGEYINPFSMPVTRIVNTSIDGVSNEAQAVFEDILRYAGNDVICYRASSPQELVDLQNKHWDPVLDWALSNLGAGFETCEGLIHVPQPKEAIAAYGSRLKSYISPISLACLHTFTTLSGSALLSLALADGLLDAESAWNAAHVDEDWNISQWGEDHEAVERRKARWQEMRAANALFQAITGNDVI